MYKYLLKYQYMPWLTSGSQVSKVTDPAMAAACLLSETVVPAGRPGPAAVQWLDGHCRDLGTAGAGGAPNSIPASALQLFHGVGVQAPLGFQCAKEWRLREATLGCVWDKMKAAAFENFHPLLPGLLALLTSPIRSTHAALLRLIPRENEAAQVEEGRGEPCLFPCSSLAEKGHAPAAEATRSAAGRQRSYKG